MLLFLLKNENLSLGRGSIYPLPPLHPGTTVEVWIFLYVRDILSIFSDCIQIEGNLKIIVV